MTDVAELGITDWQQMFQIFRHSAAFQTLNSMNFKVQFG